MGKVTRRCPEERCQGLGEALWAWGLARDQSNRVPRLLHRPPHRHVAERHRGVAGSLLHLGVLSVKR